MSLRNELIDAIRVMCVRLPTGFDDHTSLIRSGLLESAALVELVLWVEERVEPGMDLSGFDLSEEWDTVAKLLAFIHRHRRDPA